MTATEHLESIKTDLLRRYNALPDDAPAETVNGLLEEIALVQSMMMDLSGGECAVNPKA